MSNVTITKAPELQSRCGHTPWHRDSDKCSRLAASLKVASFRFGEALAPDPHVRNGFLNERLRQLLIHSFLDLVLQNVSNVLAKSLILGLSPSEFIECPCQVAHSWILSFGICRMSLHKRREEKRREEKRKSRSKNQVCRGWDYKKGNLLRVR